MPSLECIDCQGTGYFTADDGGTMICSRCDGTGVVFVDDAAGEADVRDRLH